MYTIILAALLSITVPSAVPLTTPASLAHGGAPVGIVVSVSVTPTRLMVLDTATFAVTFSAARPASGPYTAILELQPRAGGLTRSAAQGGFHLYRDQSLRLYWEWRAGTTLPPGVYTVRVRLRDTKRRIVATGTAPTLLVVAQRS
jgi:hypothetical protein